MFARLMRMRILPVLVGLALSVTVACHPQTSVARAPGSSCNVPPALAQMSNSINADALAGEYAFSVYALGPYHHASVTGVLWLWPTSSKDSSVRRGRRAAAGDTVRRPLFGVTNIDVYDVTAAGPTDEPTLRRRTDPVYPEVLVGAERGVYQGKAWSDVVLWIGSVMNSRDGSMWLDGAGYHFIVTARDSTGFRGVWGAAGIVETDTGYFCAERVPRRISSK